MSWLDYLRGQRPRDTRLFDPARTVQIGGSIDDALVVGVTPRILELKAEPAKPIYLLVDSPGGAVHRFEQLVDLLFWADREGRRSEVHAVITGPAMSAAADLIVLCDFAAAFPNAMLHFHGIRAAKEVLTEEASLEQGTDLNAFNVSNARRLATHIFKRMLDTYGRVRAQLSDLGELRNRYAEALQNGWSTDVIDIAPFAAAIWSQLPDGTDAIVDDAVRSMSIVSMLRHEHLDEDVVLSTYVERELRAVAEHRRDELRHRLRTLTVLLIKRIQADPESELQFADLVEVAADLDYLVESSSSDFGDEPLFATVEYLALFLDPKECSEMQRIAQRQDGHAPEQIARFDDLTEKAYRRAAPVWAFSLAIARLFQHGEIPLDPESAWWLGLIDHVVGTDFDRRLKVEVGPTLKLEHLAGATGHR